MNTRFFTTITQTLRGKLLLWYLVSIGGIFFLSSTAVGTLLLLTLQNQIDHHIHSTINEALQIVQTYPEDALNGFMNSLVSVKGMTVVVLSPDGSPLLETNSPDVAVVTEHQLQQILTSTSLTPSNPMYFTTNTTRFVAIPVQIDTGKGILAVGYSTKVLQDTLYIMLGFIFGVMLFLILPLTFIGYKRIKKELQPLEEIAQQAKSISKSARLSDRINIPSFSQELRVIQDALNTMLDRLENVFLREQDFFSDAAHTIKTPLAVLRSQIENSYGKKTVQSKLLATIDSTNETVEDLLFLSRIQNSGEKKERVSLSQLFRQLSELATTLGEEKQLTVITKIEPKIIMATDRKLLLKACSNIIFNAVSYSNKHGTILIKLKKSKEIITITISDNGIGIRTQDLRYVFTRFFRGTNAKEKGSGLGLAIAKSAIELLGGTIRINSKLNHGTVVQAKIPV